MGRLLSIGDFAQLVGLSVSAVRFYADRSLLVPARIDPSSGYRSFDPDQVAAGCLVRDLRVIGVPLAQVKAALSLPADHVQQVVDTHIAGLEAKLQEAQRAASSLGSAHRTDSLPQRTTSVAGADLMSAFGQVLPFASTDPEHPHLMTVLIEVKAGSVRIVTTDTHRLAVRDLVAIDSGDDFTALIPAAAARRWQTWLSLRQQVELRLDGRSLTVSEGEVATATQVVPADFPDYEVLLTPRETSTAVIVDREEFSDAMQRFDDMTGAVLLSASQNQLHIRRRDHSAQIECGHDVVDVHVAIDPAYGVHAAVSAIGSELVIEIEHNPLRPLLFRSATNGTFVSLLMPIKVD